MAEINQFKESMDSVGNFWQLIQKEPSAMRQLFLAKYRTVLTLAKVKCLFQVQWSDKATVREAEEDTIFCWEQFIRQCEGEIVLLNIQQAHLQ